MYKAVKQIVRKYYKYYYDSWTQPILTSNGILGGNNFAVQASSEHSIYSAWKAMNGVIQSATNAWVSAVSGNQWFTLYSPEKLKITNLGIANNDLTARAILQYQILASNDNYTWVTLASGINTNTRVYATWYIDLSSNNNAYRYYKINAITDSGLASISNLIITATKQTIVESTVDDYDFYEDVEVKLLIKEIVRKYYKYYYDSWTQPIFTSNNKTENDTEYILSASTEAEPAWKAMDGDWTSSENAWWAGNVAPPHWWKIQSSKRLKISQIQIKNEVASPVNFKTAIWQGSNDNNTWTDIANITGTNSAGYTTTVSLNPLQGYFYHRLYITENFGSSYGTGASIEEIGLTGQVQLAQESTIDDNDFYKDVEVYKAFNI